MVGVAADGVGKDHDAGPEMPDLRDHDPARVAVSMKCNFCVDRIDEAAVTGRVPGLHPEVTPACVNSCIAGAMVFGDIHDPDSKVSRLLEATEHFRMHEELGTEPGVYYIWNQP